jgi:hypothetical protein
MLLFSAQSLSLPSTTPHTSRSSRTGMTRPGPVPRPHCGLCCRCCRGCVDPRFCGPWTPLLPCRPRPVPLAAEVAALAPRQAPVPALVQVMVQADALQANPSLPGTSSSLVGVGRAAPRLCALGAVSFSIKSLSHTRVCRPSDTQCVCGWLWVWCAGSSTVLVSLMESVLWDWRFVSAVFQLLCVSAPSIVECVPLHDQPVGHLKGDGARRLGGGLGFCQGAPFTPRPPLHLLTLEPFEVATACSACHPPTLLQSLPPHHHHLRRHHQNVRAVLSRSWSEPSPVSPRCVG